MEVFCLSYVDLGSPVRSRALLAFAAWRDASGAIFAREKTGHGAFTRPSTTAIQLVDASPLTPLCQTLSALGRD